jgi:hypothetical protein
LKSGNAFSVVWMPSKGLTIVSNQAPRCGNDEFSTQNCN